MTPSNVWTEMVLPSTFPMIPTATTALSVGWAGIRVFEGVEVAAGVADSTETGFGASSLIVVQETRGNAATTANNVIQPYINREAANIFIISSGESSR
jgi:ABC-type anion transport system duplicated permease subunit